jgi:hypothetical protein
VRFEVGGVAHQLVGLVALGCELGEDAIGHTQSAPADDPVVDRIMWAIAGRRLTPASPFLITKMMPPAILLSLTRGILCDSGK